MTNTNRDLIEVGVVNAGAVGFSLAEVNEILTTISIIIAISLGLYKIFKTYKQ